MSGSSADGSHGGAAARRGPVIPASPRGSRDGIEGKIAALLLLMLAIGCVVVVRPFLSALLWAGILSASTWPIYDRLQRLLGGRRAIAAAVMVACASAVFLLPLAILTSHLVSEVTQAASVGSRWMATGLPEPPPWVTTLPLFGARLDAYWRDVAQDSTKLATEVRAYIGPIRDWVLANGVELGAGVLELVVALLISFFFYRDGMAGVAALRSALARIGGARAERLLALAGATIKSVVYGILGSNLVQAMLAALGLRIVGVPGALFLGFVLFFLALIPLAPALIFVPAILWLVQQGATGGAVFLVVWYVVVFVVLDAVLRSYLISRGGDLPLLLVFLGILGGIATFGLLGIFLGPTLLAVAYALLRAWNAAESELAAEPGGGQAAPWRPGGEVAPPDAIG